MDGSIYRNSFTYVICSIIIIKNYSMSTIKISRTIIAFSALVLAISTAHAMYRLNSKPVTGSLAVQDKINGYEAVGSLRVFQDTVEKTITVKGIKFRDLNKNGKLDVYEDFRKSYDKRAKNLLSQMSMEEKLVQLQCTHSKKTKLYPDNQFSIDAAKELFPDGLGGILRISDGYNVLSAERSPSSAQTAKLANQTQKYFIEQTRLGIPVYFVEEALHGLAVKDGTMFPSALGLSCSWNDALTANIFGTIATESRAIGTHCVLGPVLDLALDPRWGRTEETTGEDPYLTSRMGVIKVKALQGDATIPDSKHVGAFLKHFGAHGQPEGGSNAGPVSISERQLREVNFKAFKAAIEEGGALGIMPNYNEINGMPAHANKWMLDQVLRTEWGFKGLVISDYKATLELRDIHHIAADTIEAAVKALSAGVDIELSDGYSYLSLPQALRQGKIEMAQLDKAVLRVLELKLRLGIFENPYISTGNTDAIGSKASKDLALQAARQSMVLLKNENQLLPLDRKKYKKIAIIGPNADQCILGGYSQIPREKISPLAAIKEKYGDVEIVYSVGCKLNIGRSKSIYSPTKLNSHQDNLKLIREAVAVAQDADVIILMLGGNDQISREAVSPASPGDLADLELLGDQNELVDNLKALNKPMAAFIFSGPPISFVHLDNTADAIVQCWYLGQETGYAVAETLFGDNNPSGKLTISIPRSSGHLPVYYYKKPSARERGYNLDNIKPLYPFGFGLSYTSYQYSNLRISKNVITSSESVRVSVDVKNTGTRDGEEIIELYIRDKVSSVTRPVKELKDYTRVALIPGETKTISFTITPDKLKFLDMAMKEVLEAGEFTIMVGPSSEKYDTVNLAVK